MIGSGVPSTNAPWIIDLAVVCAFFALAAVLFFTKVLPETRKAKQKRRNPTRYADGRNAVLALIEQSSVCAEIGVWKGEFSRRILDDRRPRELHLIDPWQFQPDFPARWYGGVLASTQNDMDLIYQAVVSQFAGNSEVKIHRGTSEAVAATLPDRHFDWIYIDGDHSADAVLADLRSWVGKVKDGGCICLDDYDRRDENGTFGVKDGVAAFLAEAGGIAEGTPERGQFVIRIRR